MTKLASAEPRVGSGPSRVSSGPKVADPVLQSSDWRKLVASLITKRGRRCERCGKTHESDGSPVRLIGDHDIERRDGGADLDPSNVKLLCNRKGGNGRPHPDGEIGGCHNRKTAEARTDRLGRRL
ncbi:HNH endonuclease [Azospirillum sp. A26]|uniref:HNH endonuclease n=1 Tax=Azospirillum sp. A26 TaxID=3160607 RepID=UPI00366D2CCF